MGKLTGKVAIITGTASGMGYEAIKLFAAEGAKVIAGYNRKPIPQEALSYAEAQEGEIIPCKLTVSSEEDWKAAVELAVSKFGKVDILVNNAGGAGSFGKTILEETAADWIDTFSTNLMGEALGIKHCLPVMLENGGGSIINTSSSSAYSPDMGCPCSYATCKGGIHSLTKHIAIEFGKQNIRVNTVVPGAFYTGGIKGLGLTHEQMSGMYVDKAPLPPHAADPAEIAKTYLFLASDDSSFITGAELMVDGGMTI